MTDTTPASIALRTVDYSCDVCRKTWHVELPEKDIGPEEYENYYPSDMRDHDKNCKALESNIKEGEEEDDDYDDDYEIDWSLFPLHCGEKMRDLYPLKLERSLSAPF